MFPRGSSSSTSEPDPKYNPPSTAESHSQPTSSSTSSAMSISAENPSLIYLQHQERQHQSLSNLQQWPYLPPINYPAAELASRINTEGVSRYTTYMPPSATLSREEAQHLLGQHPLGVAQNAMQFQGLSMMPAMPEQLYNEQLLRSLSGRIQGSGIEPRPMYDTLQQELHMAANPSGCSVLNRTLESIGRAAPSDGGATAAGRYEETCTPRPRWCPTQDQIQILESLFNSGTTTPSRDMIVDIAAQLRKYGSIAEANVFYWFQNRKARAKRKLQPPPAALSSGQALSPPVSGAAASIDPDRSSMHSLTSAGQAHVSVLSPASEHSTQPKTRRLSLKHTSASSPTSSSSPDHQQYAVSSGHTSSSPLQQQSISINKPFAHQESTLLVPNRAAMQSSMPALSRSADQASAIFYNPWPQNYFERLPTEEGSDAPVPPSRSRSSYPHPLLPGKDAPALPAPAGTHIETFQQLLDYPRISLSLAPPTEHPSSQSLSRAGQSVSLGYNTQYPDHQMLHATSKGIMLINPQDASGGDPIIGAGSATSSSLSSAIFPQLGSSGSSVEFSQLPSHQIPQSSLPLARHQAVSMRMSTSAPHMQSSAARQASPPAPERVSSAPASVPPNLTGAEQEQLQLWDDLDSCGGAPWNQGQGHNH